MDDDDSYSFGEFQSVSVPKDAKTDDHPNNFREFQSISAAGPIFFCLRILMTFVKKYQ